MAINPVTGLNPLREQVYQERVMISIARMSEAPLRRELKRAYRAVALGDDSAIAAHEQRVSNIITAIYNRAFKKLGVRMWNAAKKSTGQFEQKKDVPLTPQFDLARTLWIRSVAAERVTQITGTTKKQAEKIIQDSLAESIELGLGEKEAAKLIEKNLSQKGGELSRLRSRIISRTESHSAAGASQHMAAKASALPMTKEWVASIGERTRDNHAIANGQQVGIDEYFQVGNDRLMFAGDPNGSAEEIINCRCVTVYGLG